MRISIYKGDTPEIDILVSSAEIVDGKTILSGPANLYGYTAKLNVKKNPRDTEFKIQSDGDISDPESGIIVFNLTSEETNLPGGNYEYYIEITNGDQKYTVAFGIMEIIEK